MRGREALHEGFFRIAVPNYDIFFANLKGFFKVFKVRFKEDFSISPNISNLDVKSWPQARRDLAAGTSRPGRMWVERSRMLSDLFAEIA